LFNFVVRFAVLSKQAQNYTLLTGKPDFYFTIALNRKPDFPHIFKDS